MIKELSLIQRGALALLAQGPVPQHMAFIMDGNRRWAQEKGLVKMEGHAKGAKTLRKILNFTYLLGVKQLTVYAFSQDNIKRDKKEVDYLMQLTREVIGRMGEDEEIFDKLGVRLKIIGNLDLSPPDVKAKMEEVQEKTASYKKFTLNVCFMYSCKEEVALAVQKTHSQLGGLFGNKGPVSDRQKVGSALLSNLMLEGEPDIVVRTGNDTRLSKFICFSSTASEIIFLKEKWPDVNLWSIAKIIMYYKVKYPAILENRNVHPISH